MHTIDLVGSCQPLGNNCFWDGSTGPRAIPLQLGCSIKQEQVLYLKISEPTYTGDPLGDQVLQEGRYDWGVSGVQLVSVNPDVEAEPVGV